MVVRWIDGFQLCGKYERGGKLGERKPVQARLPCEIWEKSRFESARCTDVFEEGSGTVGKLLLAE